MNTKIKTVCSNLLNAVKKVNLTYFITGLIIFCGIIVRLKVYFYNQSFWLDECSLGFNVINRSYLKLFNPLDVGQVAPPFFMIVCKFILDISQQIDNFAMRDIMLRLFPCLCSIISLPLFSYLVHKMFNNRYMTWVCSAMLAFNAVAINYAQEFKQYSCEMMFALILLIAFYHLDIKTVSLKKLWAYCSLFMLSIWFSSTACIIICTGYLLILADVIKNKYFDKTKAAILLLPMIANICAYYFLYFRRVNRALSLFMHEYWNNAQAFFSLNNFVHTFVEKMQNLINFPYPKLLFVFLIGSIIILFTHKEFKNRNKCVTLIPILLCITASFLNIYPFEQRLILFLLPLFIIVYGQYVLLLKNDKLITVLLIILLTTISINSFSSAKTRYIFHKEDYRKYAQILKNETPECNNVFFLTKDDIGYYLNFGYYIKCAQYDIYDIDNLWQDFKDSKIPEKLKTLPKIDYWLESAHSSPRFNNGPKLKEYIYNDPHLEVIDIWTAPYDENVYLIHFKKIKDYK